MNSDLAPSGGDYGMSAFPTFPTNAVNKTILNEEDEMDTISLSLSNEGFSLYIYI